MPLKRSRKKFTKKQGKSAAPSDSTTVYRGPIDPPAALRGLSRSVQQLTLTQVITSSAGGLINTQFLSNPSGASEWGDFTPIYEEYRVLGMEVHWEPFYPHWGSTAALAQNQVPMIWWPQRDAGATAPTTYTGAFQYAGAKVRNVQDRTTTSIRMSGTLEAEYQNTRTPASVFLIGCIAVNCSVSINYGIAFVRYLVEFRSRN